MWMHGRSISMGPRLWNSAPKKKHVGRWTGPLDWVQGACVRAVLASAWNRTRPFRIWTSPARREVKLYSSVKLVLLGCLEIATAALDADTGFRSSDVVDIPLPHGSQQASSSKAFPSKSKPCPAGRKGLDWRRRPAGFPQGGQCWAEGVPAMLRWGVWLRLYAWVEEDASAGMSANDAHSGVVF